MAAINIPALVKGLRQRLGLTQEQFAHEVGVTFSTVKAAWVELGYVEVPLPLPEDLIIMKAVAHRPQDLADIEAILAAHPKLNLRRVRRWLREFAAALSMPEILNDLEALLSRRT